MIKVMTVEKMKDILESICRKYGYEIFVKAFISWDLDIEDEDKLNAVYDVFMENDNMQLISEEIQNMLYID